MICIHDAPDSFFVDQIRREIVALFALPEICRLHDWYIVEILIIICHIDEFLRLNTRFTLTISIVFIKYEKNYFKLTE